MEDGLGMRVRTAVREHPPVYFALVMATGIISVGLQLEGVHWLSMILFVITAVSFVVLLIISGWRLIRYRDAMIADLSNPAKGFQFYTFVAATNVLATRFGLENGMVVPAIMLSISLLTWLFLGYAVPWAVMISHGVRPVLNEADGTWFIWAVASQSVAVLAASLQPQIPGAGDALSVVAILSWSVGTILYATIGITLIVRLLAHGISPHELGPSYWVAMGASAITVLAGSRIIEMTHTPMVDVTRGLVMGGSVVFWAFATWLIPVLVSVGWWRHARHQIPLRYEPAMWSIIFPLGMYAVCSIYLGEADKLPLVGWIGSVFLWVAFGAWLIAILAMFVRLFRVARPARNAVSAN